MVARCLVFLTGTFLNMVANNSFIVCSFNGFVVPGIEQLRCQMPKRGLDY
jgi:hypothetical protein